MCIGRVRGGGAVGFGHCNFVSCLIIFVFIMYTLPIICDTEGQRIRYSAVIFD